MLFECPFYISWEVDTLARKSQQRTTKKPVDTVTYTLGDLPDSNAYIRTTGNIWRVHPKYEKQFVEWMESLGYDVVKHEPMYRPICQVMPWYYKD